MRGERQGPQIISREGRDRLHFVLHGCFVRRNSTQNAVIIFIIIIILESPFEAYSPMIFLEGGYWVESCLG